MIKIPYKVEKKGDKFVVVNKDTGKVMGTHPTRAAAVKQMRDLYVNVPDAKENNLNFVAIIESKNLQEKDGDKWVVVEGVALKTGMSKNKVDYSINNLEENDGEMFNVLVGHRADYDNPDHNVGEGDYSLDGTNLRYKMTVKNTTTHPGIVEQIMDDMVSVSVQGGYDDVKLVEQKGKLKKVIVEGLHIPILALVNKHVRGVEGASIESAIAERIEMESKDIHEVNNMEERDVFAKQIEERDNQLAESKKLIDKSKKDAEDKDKKLKDSADKLKKLEDEKKKGQAKEHESLVDKIVETNKDLKKEELMEQSDNELKIIEKYETEKVDSDSEGEGTGVVNATLQEAKESEDNILDLGLLERHGDLTMNEEAYQKFNQDIKKRVLGEE